MEQDSDGKEGPQGVRLPGVTVQGSGAPTPLFPALASWISHSYCLTIRRSGTAGNLLNRVSIFQMSK